MESKTSFQAFGAALAAWIAERTGEPVLARACAGTIATGEAITTPACVPVLSPNLWPVSRLEMLREHPPGGHSAGPAITTSFFGEAAVPCRG